MRLARKPLLYRAPGGHAATPRGLFDGIASDALVWPAGVEPAISGSRHRWDGRLPHSQMSTLGGIRTRSFRIESPASSPLSTTRARKGSGSRARTCVSRVTVARRTDSTIPERKRRQQDSNLRTTDRLRASNALPSQTRPCLQRKERESNPQGPKAHPFSRRGTAPVAVLPVTPAGIEPALPQVRAGSSPLSYGVVWRCGRRESNLRRPAIQAGALPG
jgi:hypothetical protein